MNRKHLSEQFGTVRLPRRAPAWAFMHHASPNDYEGDVSEDEFWDEKLYKAEKSGLHSSISKYGVKTPVIIDMDGDPKMLINGHRRVAAAYDIDPNTPIPYYVYGKDVNTY